jgi:hypothetical protein
MSTSLMYYNEQILKTTPRILQLEWDIGSAKAEVLAVPSSFLMYGFDAADFASQAAIDALLGTSSEFLLAAFDATAMGTDAFACIVNMGGQCAKVVGMEAFSSDGTDGVTTVFNHAGSSSALTASTLAAEIAVGADGNIACRTVLAGVDSVADGRLVIRISWIAK